MNLTILNENDYSLMVCKGDKYTRGDQEKALNMVLNKEHWKYPIDAIIPADSDINLFEEAIINQCRYVPDFETLKNGNIRVRAVGYYVAVGA